MKNAPQRCEGHKGKDGGFCVLCAFVLKMEV